MTVENDPEVTHMRKIARRWMWALGLVPFLTAVAFVEGIGGVGWAIVLLMAVICALQLGLWLGMARGYEDARTPD